MTLRTRIFLSVWLLTVAAMVAMALLLGRWTILEIQRVSVQSSVRAVPGGDSLVDTSRMTTTIERRLARGDVDEGVMRPVRAQQFTRRMLYALVIGSVVAAIATALLTSQILGRVRDLAAAVRAMRGGNLAQRVEVRGRDELADLATSFNAMSQELAESEGRRKQLLSDVSHELRTPLTNVIGSIEAIQDGLRAASPDEMAAIHGEAMMLVRLVDDLRDVTLADAGQLTLHREAVDPADAARRAAAAFPPGEGRAPIAVHVEPDLPVVRADRRRLAQVLRNLLDNARTHAAPDSIVTLSVRRDADGVAFEVHNVGHPIPQEHLDRIWERFFRVDGSRTRSTGGMGLGLAVVQRLVVAHGGSVSVASSVESGTSFRAVFPAA